MKTRLICRCCIFTLLLLSALTLTAAPNSRPNVIVILVDDMGWSDLGCYGSEIPTPNLDALAKNGLRFTQFYNAGRCCPTRASLLTGLYSHQTGIGHMTKDDGLPGYQGHLNEKCVTLAEVLKGTGYFTAMSGKWHVGQNLGVVPWERGFERSLNAPSGGFYFADARKSRLFLNGKQIADDDAALPKNWYSTDLWTQFGIKFIDEALTAKKPFFLYLAYNAPHFPLQAPAEDIAKFRHGIYTNGWDQLRAARYERQKAMGLIDPKWALSPRGDGIGAWDKLDATEQNRFDSLMSTYAACVWHVDKAVGDLTAALKARGVLDNTLILFLSDNGGNAESGPNGRYEGKQPGGPDSNVFLGQNWATLNNTPFRKWKHYVHEGGSATPLIAHWPGGIAPSMNGKLNHQPGHLIDVMPTVAELAGATYPAAFNGKAIEPMEGVSLRPAFNGQPLARPQPIFFNHEDNRAVRDGRWKLVSLAGKPWELYDIEADRTELNDLAAGHPERVAAMAAQYDSWAKRTHVVVEGVAETGSKAKSRGGKKKAAKK